jgi:hypothetical protein
MKSADCGAEGLPLFVAGSDYPQATDHIARALEYHNPWYLERYYQRPEAERAWKLSYGETDGGQAAPCVGSQAANTACDEFPFLRTEAGATTDSAGLPHAVLPHLKIIDATQNSGTGAKYGNFVGNGASGCKLQLRRDNPDIRYGRGHFIVVTAPDRFPR